jgi:hypothetical protein
MSICPCCNKALDIRIVYPLGQEHKNTTTDFETMLEYVSRLGIPIEFRFEVVK